MPICSDKQFKLNTHFNLISKMKHNKILLKFCLFLVFIFLSITRVKSNSKGKNQKLMLKHPHPFEAQYIY